MLAVSTLRTMLQAADRLRVHHRSVLTKCYLLRHPRESVAFSLTEDEARRIAVSPSCRSFYAKAGLNVLSECT
jgi:hypothetical protein